MLSLSFPTQGPGLWIMNSRSILLGREMLTTSFSACFPWNKKTHLNPFKSSSSGSSNKWEEFPFFFSLERKIFNWNHSLCVPALGCTESLFLFSSWWKDREGETGRKKRKKMRRKGKKGRRRKSCSIICVGSHHPHPNLHLFLLLLSSPSLIRLTGQEHHVNEHEFQSIHVMLDIKDPKWRISVTLIASPFPAVAVRESYAWEKGWREEDGMRMQSQK